MRSLISRRKAPNLSRFSRSVINETLIESSRSRADATTQTLHRILQFILVANRNSLNAVELDLSLGRSFQTAAQLKLTRAAISAQHGGALVSKLRNIITAQTSKDLPW